MTGGTQTLAGANTYGVTCVSGASTLNIGATGNVGPGTLALGSATSSRTLATTGAVATTLANTVALGAGGATLNVVGANAKYGPVGRAHRRHAHQNGRWHIGAHWHRDQRRRTGPAGGVTIAGSLATTSATCNGQNPVALVDRDGTSLTVMSGANVRTTNTFGSADGVQLNGDTLTNAGTITGNAGSGV